MTMDRFNLGKHSRPISTTSPEAQRWFDLGLNWCFAFNKSEGVKCFMKALESDPDCVMAHWGVAYGCGPFYNLTWRDLGEEEANRSTNTALRISRKRVPCRAALPGSRTGWWTRRRVVFRNHTRSLLRSLTAGTTTTRWKCAGSIINIPMTRT